MNEWQIAMHNPILVAPVVGWCIAQLLKVLIHLCMTRQWKWERVVGGGGMPSSHSATVGALATACLLKYGPDSFEFAMATVFAIIVMYDAMNVRLETGKQGAILNILIKNEEIKARLSETSKDKWTETVLKEYVGHTPIQVLVGLILGIVIGVLACHIMPSEPEKEVAQIITGLAACRFL
ncbi:MAG: divergent PAP2 family protein [Bacteroides sp.]|nr:divergent PAP2 family protein [Bacteroides sp.]MCM1549272.1 divergent PAP2 family protein [Clostridium sp.]